MPAITGAQRRKIWALAKEKGLTEDMVRAVVGQVSGQTSTSALNVWEAVQVIDRLAGRREYDPGGNAITPKQMWKIKDLEASLGWADKPERLTAFIKKYARVDRARWLSKRQAAHIIDGLKSILAKGDGGGRR
jgi:hypothetical protein